MPTTHPGIDLRDEAMKLTEGRGAFLDVARELTTLFREAGLSAVVIGGVAAVLHGHRRSTRVIDILVNSQFTEVAAVLESHGFRPDADRREFVRDGIPVHLVLPSQTGASRVRTVEIEGVTTVPLGDLIEMKLRSGSRNPLRAQDLADVIALIRHHKLTGEFARELDKTLSPAFRKLVRTIEREA